MSTHPPLLDTLEPFPDYRHMSSTERRFSKTLAEAMSVILDYSRQCRGCRYPLASVLSQDIIGRDRNPYRFLVWQDVSKAIGISRIQVKSSSFTEVRLFASAAGDTWVIDSRSLPADEARRQSEQHDRPSKPAFSVLHSRWTLTALDPADQDGNRVHIAGVAGGSPAGLAAMAPGPVLRWELKNVMEQTLDFLE